MGYMFASRSVVHRIGYEINDALSAHEGQEPGFGCGDYGGKGKQVCVTPGKMVPADMTHKIGLNAAQHTKKDFRSLDGERARYAETLHARAD